MHIFIQWLEMYCLLFFMSFFLHILFTQASFVPQRWTTDIQHKTSGLFFSPHFSFIANVLWLVRNPRWEYSTWQNRCDNVEWKKKTNTELCIRQKLFFPLVSFYRSCCCSFSLLQPNKKKPALWNNPFLVLKYVLEHRIIKCIVDFTRCNA